MSTEKNNGDSPEYYKSWYADNKKELLAERRKRYRNDPEYRKQMRLNARLRREEAKRQSESEKPDSCVHLLKDVCAELDLSVASFHTMVHNNYIPPVTVWKRKAYLSDTQKSLLTELVQSIANKDRKALSHPSPETQAVLDKIKTNW